MYYYLLDFSVYTRIRFKITLPWFKICRVVHVLGTKVTQKIAAMRLVVVFARPVEHNSNYRSMKICLQMKTYKT